MPHRRLLLCGLAFFLSGAAALTFEILWQRRMFLTFGASAPATTAILTAVFVGIAFGGRLGPPLLRAARNPFLAFAGLEFLIGTWGLLVPILLRGGDRAYVAGVAALGEGHPLQALLRFALAVTPLLPATLAMGATIPVMIRCLDGVGPAAALAYGVNIFGAVAGSLLTGLVLLERLGLAGSHFFAAACNAGAGLVAASLGLRAAAGERAAAPASFEDGPAPPRRLLGAYFFAGFVALGLEVVWLRYLGIVNTNSTATFTLALSAYLAGMGFGSLVVYPALRRAFSPGSVFGIANGGVALAALATFPMVYRAAAVNHAWIVLPAADGTLTLGSVYLTEGTIVAALMLLPATFMGLVYPAVCDSHPRAGDGRDRWVGNAYFVGTLGSVAGILSVATWLVPTLGLHGTFALLAATSAAICAAAAIGTGRGRSAAAAGVFLAAAGLSAAVASVGRPVLRETAAERRGGGWVEVPVSGGGPVLSELLRVRDGATATVVVKRPAGSSDRLVYVDDQLVASTNLEAKVDSLMLAHLPLLLHPAPRSALTVGFGTGGTSAAMVAHGVETACVEIEPEVPRAAGLLRGQNFGVLGDPRFRLILNDARDHLHAGAGRYDVIATDVTNLQYKQNGNLYTVEYFELMRDRLTPGGVACAWIPMAAIDTSELRTLMRGFGRVFPHATLWFMNHTHTNFGILIGTPGPLRVDYRRVAAGFADAAVGRSLRLVGMTHPMQFVHCLHLDEAGYARFCGDGVLHTDDRPVLEFSSPMSFYRYHETFRDNLAATLRGRPLDVRRHVTGAPPGSDEEFRRHAAASLRFCESLLATYRYLVARKQGDRREAIRYLKEAMRHADDGMAAWPEDAAREKVYVDFFAEAQRWLEGPPGGAAR